MKIWLIQWSLNKESKTSLLTDLVEYKLNNLWINYYKLDLRNIQLDFWDGSDTESYNEDIQEVFKNFNNIVFI